jgi:periplasmic divalent cation tolerance protein
MADPGDFCFIYVTAADAVNARRLARTIVERRLAACANIIPTMESVYWWQGAIQEANECAVIFKTRRSLVAGLTDAVKAEHSYECPCVVALPIVDGNQDYLRWIGDETVAQVTDGTATKP